MSVRVIDGLEGLKSLVGQTLGTSPWLEITQDRVNAFAEATGDTQWIHCDPDRSRRDSPYGTTIAHGFLTLSLIPLLTQQVVTIEGARMGVNYGLNRVRFPNAVKVGSRIRMKIQLTNLREIQGVIQLTYINSFEVEGDDKPCCVAETVARVYF
jgi:acyl dehydratase